MINLYSGEKLDEFFHMIWAKLEELGYQHSQSNTLPICHRVVVGMRRLNRDFPGWHLKLEGKKIDIGKTFGDPYHLTLAANGLPPLELSSAVAMDCAFLPVLINDPAEKADTNAIWDVGISLLCDRGVVLLSSE